MSFNSNGMKENKTSGSRTVCTFKNTITNDKTRNAAQ